MSDHAGMRRERDNADLAIRVSESIEDYIRRMDEDLAQSFKSIFADPAMEHRDGIPWHDAPMPSRFHRCSAQTTGWVGLDQVQRCACGAIRNTRFMGWLDKNSRRKGK